MNGAVAASWIRERSSIAEVVRAPMSRVVGRYEIRRLIGRSGMASVHLAWQPALQREIALKELHAAYVEDAPFARRFVRESRLGGALNHPSIVTVYEYFEHEGVPYIAMEHLERGSLRRHVGRLTLAQVAGVLEGVLGRSPRRARAGWCTGTSSPRTSS